MIRTETSKLRALRSKTDRQLLELLSHTLDVAQDLARNPGSRDRAEEAYADVRRLLPLVSRLDRRALELRLDELAESISPPAKAACF